ncbi:penicillin-binding transpeptidase domain-containing protein [Paraclostridium sordellii]|uniref:penicillin-binding transpeptidase domain-containing protein n=1 Tax=Paraclostridium sordellii TaxID=1505 RepID=UPI0013DE9370|nr:penicillin-binding transpeptidase domain-containing protein [Paeniclostridium sordellii]
MKAYGKKVIIVNLLIILSVLLMVGCSSQSKVDKAFNEYVKYWQNKDFEKMYSMLSSESKKNITKENFIEEYEKTYSLVKANDLEISKVDGIGTNEDFNIKVKMNTIAGKIDSSNAKMKITKDNGDYKVVWNESLILPQMEKGDKVGIETDAYRGKRGTIYDRNGKVLAGEGELKQIQINMNKFKDSDEDSSINQIANILDISSDYIKNKIDQNKNPDHAIDIVSLLPSQKEKIDSLVKIPGVQISTIKNTRIYNGGEAIGSLIGHIGNITKEQLKENKGKDYNEYSKIGIGGIEEVYESKLRAIDGGKVYILKPDGKKIVIAEKKAKNGEDVKLSIDLDLQQEIYKEMKGEKGASVANNPKTGEVLAMVSSPSFDPNSYVTYITKSEKQKWEDDSNTQLERRFKNAYSPGSVMKLVTASIGLDTKAIDPNEAIDIKGKDWDGITRVTDPGRPVNLKDATKFSDNIYFAKAALKIGGEDFVKGAKKFGIGEDIKFGYPIQKSQISNSGNLNDKPLLAATGYGQGQVLITPLDMTMIYSTLGNNGNIMMPKLDITKPSEPTIYQEAIKKENLPTLIDCFSAVINDEEGTGHSAKINGVNIAGKTGTAEIKKSKDDQNGTENGWFAAVDTDQGKLAISMIIENVKDRGGSHIPTEMVKNVMEYYFNK